MSPNQPPRTPPVDRTVDRNRFLPRINNEVDRRLRAVEAKEPTTVVQSTGSITTTPTTSTPGSNISAVYMQATASAAYPLSNSSFPSTTTGGSWNATWGWTLDTAGTFGLGANAIVAKHASSGVLVVNASNTNNTLQLPGAGGGGWIKMLGSSVYATGGSNTSNGTATLYRLSGTTWSTFASTVFAPQLANGRLWWFHQTSGMQSADTSGTITTIAGTTGTLDVEANNGLWVGATHTWRRRGPAFYVRPTDLSSTWTTLSSSPFPQQCLSAVDDVGNLWMLDGSWTALGKTTTTGQIYWYADVMPSTSEAGKPSGIGSVVWLGSDTLAVVGYVSSGPAVWVVTPLGSSMVWLGTPTGNNSGDKWGTQAWRASNGDLCFTYGQNIMRLVFS